MANFKEFFKKYWLIGLLGFLVVVLAMARFGQVGKRPTPVPRPTPRKASPWPPVRPRETPKEIPTLGVSWGEIVPGQTTRDELKDALGEPLRQGIKEGYDLYFYPSESKFWPHEVVISQEKVVFVKEQVTDPLKKNLKDYTQEYGQPDQVFYNTLSRVGFAVHVFLSRGLAVTANPGDGTILEIWYFPPTTSQEFLKTWGKNLSKTPPGGF